MTAGTGYRTPTINDGWKDVFMLLILHYTLEEIIINSFTIAFNNKEKIYF